MLRAALYNGEAYVRDLAAQVVSSDQRIADLTRERDAALAAVDAVRADYAPRREPPTADEVRALAGLWGKYCELQGDAAALVFTENVRPHGVGPVPLLAWVTVSSADVVVCDDDGCGALSGRMVGGEDAEYVWRAEGPTGPVAWSELARLVEGVRRG